MYKHTYQQNRGQERRRISKNLVVGSKLKTNRKEFESGNGDSGILKYVHSCVYVFSTYIYQYHCSQLSAKSAFFRH